MESSAPVGAIPRYAWKRNLSNNYSRRLKEFGVGVGETLKLLPLAFRMMNYIRKEKKECKEPIMDPFQFNRPKACFGVACGGIGCGSIGRGWRGDFNRWGLKPGFVATRPVAADQFSIRVSRGKKTSGVVLCPFKPSSELSSWNWGFKGAQSEYHALFPRAWTDYGNELDSKLHVVCRQVSPVIPHNYTDSSFPACVFEWELENSGDDPVTVSVMFSFQNGTGDKNDKTGGHLNRSFSEEGAEGVLLHHTMRQAALDPLPNGGYRKRHGQYHEDPVTIAIAAQQREDVTISRCTRFISSGNGSELWTQFMQGQLNNVDDPSPSNNKEAIGAAVMATVTIPPRSKSSLTFTLTWDMPLARFSLGTAWARRYTRFWGSSGDGSAAALLAAHAMKNREEWERQIEDWQRPVLEDAELPDWYKALLFNELYYLVDGGSIWTEGVNPVAEPLSFPWKQVARQHWLKKRPVKKTGDVLDDPEVLSTLFALSDAPRTEGFELTEETSGRQVRVQSVAELAPNLVYRTRSGTQVERVRSDSIRVGSSYQLPFNPTSMGRAPSASFSMGPGATRDRPSVSILSDAPSSASGVSDRSMSVISVDAADLDERLAALNADSSSFVSGGGEGSGGDGLGSGVTVMTSGTGPAVPVPLDEDVGRFAYLEGVEYLMYNTYDVHFYASFALIMLFPKLELSLQRDIAYGTADELPEQRRFLGDGNMLAARKTRWSVPHDVGNPGEDPWLKVNSYNIHNVCHWKDLNAKFVLQIYRDYIATQDSAFLRDMWPVVREAVQYARQFDTDGDGLLEHGGWPDHTYDAWPASGTTAYSGGLWLACLSAASEMAETAGEHDLSQEYMAIWEKAKVSYEKKLWNGEYYNYDNSRSNHHDSIHSDQLAGLWYARACNLPSFVPDDKARSALQKVFDFNVKRVKKGTYGAMNGMRPNGNIDNTCLQSREIWTGVTYALGATMIQEGMEQEGFASAEGMWVACWNELGHWFQTPEAIDHKGRYRSLAYMRALAIWAMQWAWEERKKKRNAASATSASAAAAFAASAPVPVPAPAFAGGVGVGRI